MCFPTYRRTQCCHIIAYVYPTLAKARLYTYEQRKMGWLHETTVYILYRIVADSKRFSMLCIYAALLKVCIASYSKNVSTFYLLLVNAEHSGMSLRKHHFIQSSCDTVQCTAAM